MYKNVRRNDPVPQCCVLIMRMCFNFVILIFVARIDYNNLQIYGTP